MKVKLSSRTFRFIVVFLVSAAVFAVAGCAYLQNRMALEQMQMSQLVTTKSVEVRDVLTKLLYKAQTLAALVVQSNGQVQNFERVASTILDDPSIRNVILAPDNIVTAIYPLAGNEAAIGLDFSMDGAGNQEAKEAIERGEMVLGGPFDLVQGGQAIVGRQPVYLEENGQRKYWGLVSVTLNYPQVLAGAGLDQLQMQGLAFEIWRISPDSKEHQVIARSDYNYSNSTHYVEQPLNILNSTWYFRLSPVRMWYQYPEAWIMIALAVFVSWLIAFLALHNYDLRKIKRDLEQLSSMDPLTGILNRRGVFAALEKLLDGSPFVLCYIDLNRFKEVNDFFGHAAGDEVLRKFVLTMNQLLCKDQIFGRIGGDEFILIFQSNLDDAAVHTFFDAALQKLGEHPTQFGGKDFPTTFSWGMARYPQDGQTADQLVGAADIKMYQAKSCDASHSAILRKEER